jgi:hypothetical protein
VDQLTAVDRFFQSTEIAQYSVSISFFVWKVDDQTIGFTGKFKSRDHGSP